MFYLQKETINHLYKVHNFTQPLKNEIATNNKTKYKPLKSRF